MPDESCAGEEGEEEEEEEVFLPNDSNILRASPHSRTV